MGALNEEIKNVIGSIEEVQADTSMPKNVKDKLNDVIIILKGNHY